MKKTAAAANKNKGKDDGASLLFSRFSLLPFA